MCECFTGYTIPLMRRVYHLANTKICQKYKKLLIFMELLLKASILKNTILLGTRILDYFDIEVSILLVSDSVVQDSKTLNATIPAQITSTCLAEGSNCATVSDNNFQRYHH